MVTKHRKVNAVAFAAQMAEAVIAIDNLVEVPVDRAETASVWIKVPFNLGDDDDYAKRLQAAASDSEAVALEALGHHPTLTADEQWATWTAAGHDAKLLVNILGSETQEAQERAKNFRYRG